MLTHAGTHSYFCQVHMHIVQGCMPPCICGVHRCSMTVCVLYVCMHLKYGHGWISLHRHHTHVHTHRVFSVLRHRQRNRITCLSLCSHVPSQNNVQSALGFHMLGLQETHRAERTPSPTNSSIPHLQLQAQTLLAYGFGIFTTTSNF